MIVEQTVKSRSALVSLRRFSGGGAGGVEAAVGVGVGVGVAIAVTPRRVVRVVDISTDFGDAGGVGAGWSFGPSVVFLSFEAELWLVDESSVSGG